MLNLLLLCVCGGAGDLQIRPGLEAGRVEVVANLAGNLKYRVPFGRMTQERGETWLRLAVIQADRSEGPAILGQYTRIEAQLVLAPRHPLVAGQRYRATLENEGRVVASVEYEVPARAAAPAPEVEKVYPSSAELPANLLKFYIHFSRPMRETRTIFDHIQLLGEDGKEVADPWRRTELWSDDRRRLTLWVHPGRVKIGVNLREDLGPALEPGRRYTLVIGTAVLDEEGQGLTRAYTRSFRTTPELRERVLLEDWKLAAPRAGSREPLRVTFPRPLDRALLERLVTVLDAGGRTVPGRVEVGAEERSWAFTPAEPWRPEDYRVEADRNLEDLAGNTPERVFDLDLTRPAAAAPRLTRTFQPQAE